MANSSDFPIPNESMTIEELIDATNIYGAEILLAQTILQRKLEALGEIKVPKKTY
jgi:hypothetical protein